MIGVLKMDMVRMAGLSLHYKQRYFGLDFSSFDASSMTSRTVLFHPTWRLWLQASI